MGIIIGGVRNCSRGSFEFCHEYGRLFDVRKNCTVNGSKKQRLVFSLAALSTQVQAHKSVKHHKVLVVDRLNAREPIRRVREINQASGVWFDTGPSWTFETS